jgi:hypothetical protein
MYLCMIQNPRPARATLASTAFFISSLVALGVLGKYALCINGPTFQTKNMYDLLVVDNLFNRLCRPSS